MTSKEIKLLLNRYLKGTCSEEEKEMLEQFLASKQGEDQSWIESAYGDQLELQEHLYSKIQQKINPEKSKRVISLKQRATYFMKYAAMLMIAAIAAVYFFKDEPTEIEITDEIVLELEDGTRKTININDIQEITNSKGDVLGKQDKSSLVYQNTATDPQVAEKLVYNKLYVPYGKKFNVNLSDGSTIYLNSGSTLRYPVRFIKGLSREVYLDGEAYFEVSKNKQDEFIVHANGLNTKVYGTTFNITSYQNDDVQSVVLIEGSVGVSENFSGNETTEEMLLIPNEMACIDNEQHQISKKTVNTYNYTAWKDGELLFENERFENIIRRLERHYNIAIQNNYTTLNDIKFTGSFDIENIEQILRSFNSYSPFTYTIDQNQVTINP